MHEEADKKEFIVKFLNHINLGTQEEIILFTSKTSHIQIAVLIFFLVSIISIMVFPNFFPLYKLVNHSSILKFLNLNHNDVFIFLMITTFILCIKIYAFWKERNELIQSLNGFRILLDYMRVDELSLVKYLKQTFPDLAEFEIVDFTKAVFVSKLLVK
ncbi:hypothetical protein EHQ46_03565 [Leptospira yanagawae]|uniref:Uncharacterized protein n=1 Tax=Leptospira yanagawae TaxID=293069 RepID=A0ABY2M4T0_9LEPT|nr:hypothetical protein [Leptospira yanagawae]TGL24207.1 hypothetical protein EHQ46_03565 [Leptospira yanagawae]